MGEIITAKDLSDRKEKKIVNRVISLIYNNVPKNLITKNFKI